MCQRRGCELCRTSTHGRSLLDRRSIFKGRVVRERTAEPGGLHSRQKSQTAQSWTGSATPPKRSWSWLCLYQLHHFQLAAIKVRVAIVHVVVPTVRVEVVKLSEPPLNAPVPSTVDPFTNDTVPHQAGHGTGFTEPRLWFTPPGGYDGGDGIAVNGVGNGGVTGTTGSTDVPITASAFQIVRNIFRQRTATAFPDRERLRWHRRGVSRRSAGRRCCPAQDRRSPCWAAGTAALPVTRYSRIATGLGP
jgi:hypothetical protein